MREDHTTSAFGRVTSLAQKLWRGGAIMVMEGLKLSPVYEVGFGRHRFKFRFLPLGAGFGSRGLYFKRENYETLLQFGHELIEPGFVIIDCGANQGIYTVAFGVATGPSGRVVAVEPIPEQAKRAKANIELNGLTNSAVVEAAISDHVGRATLQMGGKDVEASIVHAVKEGKTIDVATTTLSQIVKDQGLSRLDFIKLDVEGAEEMAIKGGEDVLAQFKPIVVCEALGDGPNPVPTRMGALGYRSFIRGERTYEEVDPSVRAACVFYFNQEKIDQIRARGKVA